jgi:SAM-dependent methyltransferase
VEPVQWLYPETRFGGFTDIDSTVAFYARVNTLLEPRMTVLDFGCGPGSLDRDPVVWRRSLRVLRGKTAHVIGLDVDEAARKNPFVDEFRQLNNGEKWPVESGTVDFVLCDFVLEHLPAPEAFFEEAARVLREEGIVAVRTPNLLSYFGLIARWTPAAFKTCCLKMAQPTRDERDVYLSYYRCNTVAKLRRALERNGFDHAVYGYEAEPSYLSFSKVAYVFGALHQRFAPRPCRVVIFAFGRLKRYKTARTVMKCTV